MLREQSIELRVKEPALSLGLEPGASQPAQNFEDMLINYIPS